MMDLSLVSIDDLTRELLSRSVVGVVCMMPLDEDVRVIGESRTGSLKIAVGGNHARTSMDRSAAAIELGAALVTVGGYNAKHYGLPSEAIAQHAIRQALNLPKVDL